VVVLRSLFLADLSRRRAVPRAFPCRYGTVRPRVDELQLPLFIVPREYRYGRVDLRSSPAPENSWLAWALNLAHTMAESRGFDPKVHRALNRTLVMLLGEHRDGELIRSSEFHQALRDRGTSIEQTSEILQKMGVLLDDRPATFEKWLQRKLDGLAPGIRSETERWARTLHDGSPRSRPRSPHTVKKHLRHARHALLEWSARYLHLREVTREDILAHIDGLHGHQRQQRIVALRSLFAWAKKNGVIFRDPASRLKVSQLDHPVWQPLPPEEIARTIQAATTPHAQVFVALAAVRAARSGTIRAVQLDNVDLANRRLTIVGHIRPLDKLTHQILLQWLDYRRRRWPNTANRHLLINTTTALRLNPVSATRVNQTLQGLTGNLERLRIDRQLEEALTHGADPLHLTVVFNINETTASHYAASVRQLLEKPHETHPAGSPPTQASICEDEPPEHLSSC
jgi:site-specific recombinase XerC